MSGIQLGWGRTSMAPSVVDPGAGRTTCPTCGRYHKTGWCMDEWRATVDLVASAEATAIKRAQRGDRCV